MKNQALFTQVLLVLCMAIYSCQNDECLTTNEPDIEQLLINAGGASAETLVNHFKQQQESGGSLFIFTEGSAFDEIKRGGGLRCQYANGSYPDNGHFRINDTDLLKDGGALRIFDEEKMPQLLAVYGATANINFTTAGGGVNALPQTINNSANFNFPKPLVVNRLNVSESSVSSDGMKTFSKNQAVEWTPDPGNDRIYILIYAGPDPLTSAEIPNVNNVHYHLFSVPDNGSYTFTPNDFPQIPDNVAISLYMLRFNSLTVEDGLIPGRQHLIAAVSGTGGYYRITNTGQ